MKLSELVKNYRKENNISQRKFSEKCDLSNTYISYIEKEKNPKTNKPVVPTIEVYKKLADGMDITVQELFEQLDDDAPVDLQFSICSDPSDPPLVINNMDQFAHLMQYMTKEDYDYVVAAFDRAHKKMIEKGVKL